MKRYAIYVIDRNMKSCVIAIEDNYDIAVAKCNVYGRSRDTYIYEYESTKDKLEDLFNTYEIESKIDKLEEHNAVQCNPSVS